MKKSKFESEIARACWLARSKAQLARTLTEHGYPVSPQAVGKWVRAKKTPHVRALQISELVPGVDPVKLCPDFPWDKVVRACA